MCAEQAGVYCTTKKDGALSYRASLTHKGKHISLGSYSTAEKAHAAYEEARKLMDSPEADILSYSEKETTLAFTKWVAMINLRDNGIYCNGPIYLHKKYFDYYLDQTTVFRFSADDLFYYTHHNIQRRGGHLFVADYGMQVSILSRYGVKAFAVKGRDYYFKNGDETDFRSGNLVVVNGYVGVLPCTFRGKQCFKTVIHVKKSDYVVGHYETEQEAAIAYNKAAALLKRRGSEIKFRENYIEGISDVEYKLLYERVRISRKLLCLSG